MADTPRDIPDAVLSEMGLLPEFPTRSSAAVWTFYRPEEVVGEFGWIWANINGQGRRWHLVSTECEPGEITIRFIDAKEGNDFEECGDLWLGRPYLPCSAPTVTPGEIDAGEVTCRLPDGASITAAYADPEVAMAAARLVMMAPGRDEPEAAA